MPSSHVVKILKINEELKRDADRFEKEREEFTL